MGVRQSPVLVMGSDASRERAAGAKCDADWSCYPCFSQISVKFLFCKSRLLTYNKAEGHVLDGRGGIKM